MESEFASYDMNLCTCTMELRYIVFDYLPPLFQGRTFCRRWLAAAAAALRAKATTYRGEGIAVFLSEDRCGNRFLPAGREVAVQRALLARDRPFASVRTPSLRVPAKHVWKPARAGTWFPSRHVRSCGRRQSEVDEAFGFAETGRWNSTCRTNIVRTFRAMS